MSSHPSTPSSGLIIADRCAECLRTESESRNKLKRCAACSGSLYCSKECQRKNWTLHKKACRAQWKKRADDLRTFWKIEPPTPSDATAATPSETVAALTTAMNTWTELYSYTFANIATAAVYSNGGFAEHVGPDPHAMLFFVRPWRRTQGSDGNPAESFHLSGMRMVPPEEGGTKFDKSLKDARDFWRANWSRSRETALRKGVYHDDSVECGAMPALYILQDSDVMSISTVVVRRLSPARDNLTDESSLFVFDDIIEHCLDIMQAGLVLQHSSGPGHSRLPDIGKMVRQKKREWRWERISGWDWAQSDRRLPPANPRKTNLDAAQLWGHFLYD